MAASLARHCVLGLGGCVMCVKCRVCVCANSRAQEERAGEDRKRYLFSSS